MSAQHYEDDECNNEDHYFEYRRCLLGGIPHAKNPRDKQDWDKDFKSGFGS